MWVRDGFPDSLQAPSAARSLKWRQDFIRTYLERDVPQFGPRIATQPLRLLWTLLAHQQGGLVNTTQVYVRDSGHVHALLDLPNKESLLSQPVIGASWEGLCLENIMTCAPTLVQACFYRSSGGAEVDLLLQWPGGELWAVEIKRSLSPKVERVFHAACGDLNPTRKLVVYPGSEHYPLGHDVDAIPLARLCEQLFTPSSTRP